MANLTVEEIVIAGLARVPQYSRAIPAVRSVFYRRVSTRQQELAMMAAQVNREYFGVASDAALVGGAADLADIVTPVPTPEMIERIEVSGLGGGSPYAIGTEVSLVRLSDAKAEEAPRVTLRNGVLRQVGTDLATITSIKVYYAKIPDSFLSTEDGTSRVAIPAPYDQLLVLDIAELVIDHALRGSTDDVPKATAMTDIAEEQKEWEGKWLAHVRGFGATRSRFQR